MREIQHGIDDAVFRAVRHGRDAPRLQKEYAKEFFAPFRYRHPDEIDQGQMQHWRDPVIALKKSEATVRLKLSIIRSMCDYLKIAGIVDKITALTKLFPPAGAKRKAAGPGFNEQGSRYPLAGPDQNTSEGARAFAFMRLMLMTSWPFLKLQQS